MGLDRGPGSESVRRFGSEPGKTIISGCRCRWLCNHWLIALRPRLIRLVAVFLTITDSELNKPDGEEHEDVLGAGRRNCYFYKISFPVTFSPEEVDLYKAYQNEIGWYDAQLQTAPSAEDALRLNLEEMRLSEN
jgi:hypothetical protein